MYSGNTKKNKLNNGTLGLTVSFILLNDHDIVERTLNRHEQVAQIWFFKILIGTVNLAVFFVHHF